MRLPSSTDRPLLLARKLGEACDWSRLIDRTSLAIAGSRRSRAAHERRMEELRHKQESFVIRIEALGRHLDSGWSGAWVELLRAQDELETAWASFRESQRPRTPQDTTSPEEGNQACKADESTFTVAP